MSFYATNASDTRVLSGPVCDNMGETRIVGPVKQADILIRCARKELSFQVKQADILIRCARKLVSELCYMLLCPCLYGLKPYNLMNNSCTISFLFCKIVAAVFD